MLTATETDYRSWTGDAAATVGIGTLRAASLVVAARLRYAQYDADPATGDPRRPAQMTAVRDAICAQIAWWSTAGEDGSGGAREGAWASASINVASYTRDPASTIQTVGDGGSFRLAPVADLVLQQAGLGRRIRVRG